jgi:hypothetical protein
VDFEADEVADDEERRVFKGFVILVELPVCFFEVAALGLLLPGKPAAFPDIGEAGFAGASLLHVLFKGIAGAYFVFLSGMRNAEGFAEIAKVLRSGGTLVVLACVPLADEVQDVDGH